MDAFDAGKQVYCEKSTGYDIDQCFKMYNKHKETGLIFFAGQQRLFDPLTSYRSGLGLCVVCRIQSTEIEQNLFDTLPFTGTSWAPETAQPNKGEYITGKRPNGDGTDLLTAAFVEAVITHKQPENIAKPSLRQCLSQ
ncbi:hypothetical protein AGMMS50239_21540 [Bacteroidia bacterium]|nr:hypothetical protein AGMMS50239_21540 [Bacteroidia bacterium]